MASNPQKDKDKKPHWRVNYEDHSLKFLDWVDRIGFEKTFFGRWVAYFEEKFQFRKFFFVFLFSLILAWVLTFEFTRSMDFQVGEIAKYDVTSPLSFEMVDEVTTEEKRLKAEFGIPVIFDYDPAVYERVSGGVYRAFRLMRMKVRHVIWPRSQSGREEVAKDLFIHKGEFEREIGVAIPDYIFEWLAMNRFSARFENALLRNLDKWYQLRIAEDPEKAIPTNQSVVLARTVQKNNSGREIHIAKVNIRNSGNPEQFDLQDLSGLEKVSTTDKNNLLVLARALIYPNLTLNKQEVATRKQAARDTVLPITVSIKKNQTIVSENTVVQPFHMAIMKQIQILKSDRRQDITMVSMALLFLAIIIVFLQYLKRFSTSKLTIENKDFFAMGLVTIGIIVIVKIFLFLTESALVAKFGALIPTGLFLFAAPVAAAPMLVGLVITSGEIVWLFCAFLSITMGMMTEMNFPFMLVTFAGGIAAARGVFACKKRNDIYWAGVRSGAVSALTIALLITIEKIDQPGFGRELLFSVPAGFIGGILASFIAMTLIPLVESIFNYTTDVKLLELSNLNHPLLKEMIVRAPGTYHHSMLVGSMVEAASEQIGANPLLAKVMSYYHDIGKMEHSNYFIENQKTGQNPHDHISPYMSKTLLVAHVKDGVELGMSHHLGKPIIDGIIQHHGTTLISFFYNKALDEHAEEDPEVQEEEFRYPGPKPQFRESALIMLADSIEAAARSLDEPTPVRLQNIVRNIVQRKFMEGQLDECSLTLKDLSRVEESFTRILLGIYHQRIDYPRHAGGGASETPKASLFSVDRKSN